MAGKPLHEFLSYDDLRPIAERFLAQHHPAGTIPVPIEEIIDLRFKMDIVPLPGLRDSFDIDAFISRDLTTIHVDEFIYKHRPCRLRFSLAHELSHAVLHKAVFSQLAFDSVAEWKQEVLGIAEDDYRFLEWQANALAGLILVPSAVLAGVYRQAVGLLPSVGLSLAIEPAWPYVLDYVAKQFDVSSEVIDRRIRYDGLRPG